MGFSLSQGPYEYNRFDAYESNLDEGSKVAAPGADSSDYSKTAKAAGYTDTDKFGKAIMSAAGKPEGGNPRRELSRLQNDPSYMQNRQKLASNKERLEKSYKKEELNTQETEDSTMDSYVNALSHMASNPSYGMQISEKKDEEDEKKKGKKGSKPDYLDFDKDGDKEESMKKALKEKGSKKEDEDEKDEVDEAYEYLRAVCESYGYDVSVNLYEKAAQHHKVTGVEKKAMAYGAGKNINPKTGRKKGDSDEEKQAAAGKKAESEGKKKAFMNKMKAAAAGTPGGRASRPGAGDRLLDMTDKMQKAQNEEITLEKEDVIDWLIAEDYATNEVSAEVMFEHMSDDFLAGIEKDIFDFINEES